MSSTNPVPPKKTAGATAAGILTSLEGINGELTLAIQVGSVVIPLIVGAVKSIKTMLTGTTVEYTVALTTTQAELEAIIQGTNLDVVQINAELARLGLPQLAVPPSS